MAKVLFAQECYFPFQSTARLSAFLKASGHEVALAIGDEKTIVDKAREAHPDLIAFSVLTPYRNHMLKAAQAIKAAGIKAPIAAGGYDVTFLPEILEYSDLDIVCRGEGEWPLKELCDALDQRADYTGIANLWVKQGEAIHKNRMREWAMDMDALPFDDRDLYLDYDSYFRIVPFTQVLVGRGCPYPCSYCFNDGYRKLYEAEGSRGYCKLRSVDKLMEELLILKEKYKSRYLFFNDSTLGYNKKWLLEFLRKYRELIRIPFSINLVMREVDEEIGSALKDNGYCELIRFGLETGDEQFRRTVLNKTVTDEQYFRGVGILQKNGIRYSISMMLGLPGESEELAWKTLEMARRLSGKRSVHAVNIFKPFPGLKITDYGIRIGQYDKNEISGLDVLKAAKHADDKERLALGARDLCYYENYRVDPVGQKILRLSRFSHLAIRFPVLHPLIRLLIRLPDNAVYRFIWMVTESLLNIKAHANVPASFFIQYFLFHSKKKIR